MKKLELKKNALKILTAAESSMVAGGGTETTCGNTGTECGPTYMAACGTAGTQTTNCTWECSHQCPSYMNCNYPTQYGCQTGYAYGCS